MPCEDCLVVLCVRRHVERHVKFAIKVGLIVDHRCCLLSLYGTSHTTILLGSIFVVQ